MKEKILFVSHFSFLYGANRSLYSLIHYFKDQGLDVGVLMPSKGKFYVQLQKEGIPVYSMRFFFEVMYVKFNPKYLSLPLLWIYNLIVFPFLVWKIHKINPDVIYSNSSVDAYSIWVAKILGKKHVVHIREFMYEDFGARFILGKKLKAWYLGLSDKIVIISNAIANKVFRGIPRNAKVIYNGVKKPSVVHEYNSAVKQSIRLGVVGNIDISKQQDLAIKYMPKILEKFPHTTLHIIGDKECSYKKYIIKLVDELNLKNSVIFEGFVENIEDIYKKMDVLLMCSRCEGFGRVTVESMLRNIPVIGYDSGGTTEIIEDRKTGFKFLTCDGVIEALNIIMNDPLTTSKIVERARLNAEKDFTELTYSSNVYSFIKDMLI